MRSVFSNVNLKRNDPLIHDDVLINIDKEPHDELPMKSKVPRSEPISIDDIGVGSSSSPFSGHLKRTHSDTNLSLTNSEIVEVQFYAPYPQIMLF